MKCERMKSFLALLTALAISACAAYKEPDSGPRARVRFVTDAISPSILLRYEDPACKDGERMANMKNGPMAGSPEKRIGMPLWDGFHDNAAKEFHVRAGQSVYFAFHGRNLQNVGVAPAQVGNSKGFSVSHNYSVCNMPFGVQFVDGADYEIRLITAPSCSVEIFELKPNGSAVVRVANASVLRPLDRQSCDTALAKYSRSSSQ